VTGISIAKSLELHLVQSLVTREQVRAGCERAGEAHLASVCVWPAHVELAAEVLAGSDTRVRAAIGFPYGQDTVPLKLAACDRALVDGAHELAIMLDHSVIGEFGAHGGADAAGAMRDELVRVLQHSWWSALNAARGRAEVTVVLETTMLDLAVTAPVFEALAESPAGFLQTGTGHQHRAVTAEHVRALREQLPADVAIIAVGGIATLEDAAALVSAGAVRVGSGTATAIAEQERHERAARG